MKTVQPLTSLSQLVCSQCGQPYSAFEIQSFSTCCRQPLAAQYNLAEVPPKTVLYNRPATMWRYKEVLPVLEEENIVSLGEGMTPILELKRLQAAYELPNLFLKDESMNPTGSFKARGLSAAVSKAKEFGIDTCIGIQCCLKLLQGKAFLTTGQTGNDIPLQ